MVQYIKFALSPTHACRRYKINVKDKYYKKELTGDLD